MAMQNVVSGAHDTSVGGKGGDSSDQIDPSHNWVVEPMATHRVVFAHDTCWSELAVASAPGFAATDQTDVSAPAGGPTTRKDKATSASAGAHDQNRWFRLPTGVTDDVLAMRPPAAR